MSTLEWALIKGVPAPDDAGPSRIRGTATALAEADFGSVLLSSEAQAFLTTHQHLFTDLFSDGSASGSSSALVSSEEEALLGLTIAIALQHAYVQTNWTGPALSFTPMDILGSSGATTNREDINVVALPLLTLQGEPAYHLTTDPFLLLLSIRILEAVSTSPYAPITSAWWSLRTHLVHQALLDEAVELPKPILDGVKALSSSLPADDPDLAAALQLEIGLYHHSLSQDKLANLSFLAAARASGLEFELTGALGRKTKYQVNALSQLVLLAESRARADDPGSKSAGEPSTYGAKSAATGLPETLALNDDTLLEETAFTKVTSSPAGNGSTSRLSHLDPSSQPPLHPLDQSLLISLCLAQHNNAPSSGLTASQMTPFIARVVSHPRNWSVHTTALILRSRLESLRSRTVERSALQLQALIEQMPTSDSEPKERLRYFHQLPLPSQWQMERELAKRFLSLGVVRSALDIFTKLEMWEDAVLCLQKLEKEDEAVSIVRDLLEGRKVESELVQVLAKSSLSDRRRSKMGSAREAKLWCLLGDLALSSDHAAKDPASARQSAIEHYERAWTVSGESSARAMRSLGSLKLSAHEYAAAVECFRKSLAISPLFARVWFSLGTCLIRLERWQEAREAFQRNVGVDEEDAEAWNNLAAVYLRLQEGGPRDADEESTSASYDNKLLAFRALRQGVRYAPTNWRMWQNYMIVAVDVGELAEAARAQTRLLGSTSLTPGEAVDPDVLDKLVDSVTRDDYAALGRAAPSTSNEGFGLLPIVQRLFDESVLPRVSDSARVWRTHARLLRWKEDWGGALDDYVRAYRCAVTQDERVERELEAWRRAVEETEETVSLFQLLGPKTVADPSGGEAGGAGEKRKGDWRFQARGLVRTFIGRTREAFGDEPEMDRLRELLDELKAKE